MVGGKSGPLNSQVSYPSPLDPGRDRVGPHTGVYSVKLGKVETIAFVQGGWNVRPRVFEKGSLVRITLLCWFVVGRC